MACRPTFGCAVCVSARVMCTRLRAGASCVRAGVSPWGVDAAVRLQVPSRTRTAGSRLRRVLVCHDASHGGGCPWRAVTGGDEHGDGGRWRVLVELGESKDAGDGE